MIPWNAPRGSAAYPRDECRTRSPGLGSLQPIARANRDDAHGLVILRIPNAEESSAPYVVARRLALGCGAEARDQLQRIDVAFVDTAYAEIGKSRAAQCREFAASSGERYPKVVARGCLDELRIDPHFGSVPTREREHRVDNARKASPVANRPYHFVDGR